MGTPHFAVWPLEALAESPDFDVVAVVTQEDKKVGRKQLLTSPPVKGAAEEHSIPVLQPPSLKNNDDFVEILTKLAPDFIVVVAYGQILPQTILDIPTHGCINIHGSLLPNYRGASPIEEALRQGDKETGLTFIQMTAKMDAGPIMHIQRAPIDPKDTAATLREKLSILAGKMIPAVLQDILDGVAHPIEQNHDQATYCHKISKKDGLINLSTMTAQEIHNHVRAYTPWPTCFIRLGEKTLKLLEIETKDQNAKPGELVDLEDGKIAIGTKKGLIVPLKVQLEGKGPMEIQDFLRGNRESLNALLASPK